MNTLYSLIHIPMTRMRVLVFMLTFFAVHSVHSASIEDLRNHYARHTEAHLYENESGQTMPYRLFIPPDYNPEKKYPLVLSFHGAGSRGRDNRLHLRPWVAGWIDTQIQNQHPCIILMPQCPANQQWVNTPWERGSYSQAATPISQSMTLAKEILDTILREKSIDSTRIYVMGLSMGGYAAWDFAMRYPELVAAAVPVCGGGDPSKAHILKDIPIWAFHGELDRVVPPSGSLDMVNAILQAGGDQIELTLYRGVKHDSYTLAWRTPKLIDWVFSQQKKDVPQAAENR